jgi:hypothetical protein
VVVVYLKDDEEQKNVEGGKRIMDSLSTGEQVDTSLITTVMNHPIVKHTTVDVT